MRSNQAITGPLYFGTAKKKSCFEDGDRSAPGPGAHSPTKDSKISVPEWKIGSSTNRNGFLDPHRAKIPSPQHYHVQYDAVEKMTKNASIPLSVYVPKPMNENFSGFYENKTSFVKTALPEFSFGYSLDHSYQTPVPGPGAYEALEKHISMNKTQSGFTGADRPLPYGQQGKFPGPGKYSTISFNQTAKYSFGKATRSEHKTRDPPARFYDITSKKPIIKAGRGASTEYKRQPTFLTPNQYPAPGTYNNQLPKKIPNGVIQSSLRRPLQQVEVVSYPSCDKYNTFCKDFTKGKGVSFSKDIRHLSVEQKQIPGPGTYEPMPTLSKIGGAVAKKQEKADEEKLVLPDPAFYKVKDEFTRKKASSTLVLRANRVDFSKTITGIIGPGQYNLNSMIEGQLGKLGKSHRSNAQSPDKNPGVGSYNLPSTIGQLPKYCSSPKKTNQFGYSTFHQKLKLKLMQKQRIPKTKKTEKQESQQEQDPYVTTAAVSNPQQLKS